MTRVVCLSDTHNRHGTLAVPDGDVLIHAGDLTGRGSAAEIAAANEWLGGLPHPHKIVIAGNHDFLFENKSEAARPLLTNAVYLQDSGAEVGGLRVWGSPWQPWFHDWAFNLPRGKPLREKWEQIPEGLDVLVTHGPPMEILDRTVAGEHVGCEELRARLEPMESPPRLHVFGHIHEARGIHRTPRTTFVNASVCDVSYQLVHEAAVVEL